MKNLNLMNNSTNIKSVAPEETTPNNKKYSFNLNSIHSNTKNQLVNLDDIIKIIKNDKPDYYDEISIITKTYLYNVKNNKNKQKIDKLKNKLPHFLLSGYQEIGHNNTDIEYNGCFQIDIDFKIKDGNLLALNVKELLKEIPYIIFAGISPSTFGVKALVYTNNTDKKLYKIACNNVISDLSEKLNIDKKYFDVLGISQPTFAFFDKDLYTNINPIPYEVNINTKVPEKTINVDKYIPNTDIERACEKAYKYASAKHSTEVNVNFIQSYIPLCSIFGIDVEIALNFLETKRHFLKNKYIFAARDIFKRYPNIFNTANDIYKKPNTKKYFANHYLKENQYLTDINLSVNNNCIIEAPVGTGKTFWVAKQPGKKILVVPTQGLVKQCSNLYNASPYFQDIKEISDFICVTYSSINNLIKNINISEYDIYIDEAHNFTVSSNSNYLLEPLNNVLNIMTLAKKYVLLTATPVFSFENKIDSLPIIKINKESNINKNIINIEYTNILGTIDSLTKKSIDNNNFPVILLNNTNETGLLGKIQSTLELNGSIINANKKDSKEFQDIIINGNISENTDYLISTTVLKEGISITNHKENIDIMVIGKFHPLELEQFAARFRNAKNINIQVLKKAKIRKPNFFNFKAEKELIFNAANKILDTLKYCDIIGYNLIIDSSNNFVKNINGNLSLDLLSMSNFLFEKEKTFLYNNNIAFNNYMNSFNWNILSTEINSNILNPNKEKLININMIKNKIELQKEIDSILNKISTESIEENESNIEISSSNTEKDIRNKINYLSTVTTLSNATTLLKNNTKNNKFKALLKSIEIQILKNNKSFINSNDKIAKFLNSIYSTFKVNNTFTAPEIKNILQNLQKDILNINTNWSKHLCNNYIKCFLTLEKKQIRIGKKRTYSFKVINHNPLNFNITSSTEEISNIVESLDSFFF